MEKAKEDERKAMEAEQERLANRLKAMQQHNAHLNSKLATLSKAVISCKQEFLSLSVSSKRDLADMGQTLKSSFGSGVMMKLKVHTNLNNFSNFLTILFP